MKLLTERPRSLACLALAASFFAPVPAVAQSADGSEEIAGTCVLTYKGRIYAQGACTAAIGGGATDLNGTIEENGQRWQAVIADAEGTGALLGADTFILADGAFTKTFGSATYVWANGYALDFQADLEEEE